jgi:hypothetical protein
MFSLMSVFGIALFRVLKPRKRILGTLMAAVSGFSAVIHGLLVFHPVWSIIGPFGFRFVCYGVSMATYLLMAPIPLFLRRGRRSPPEA